MNDRLDKDIELDWSKGDGLLPAIVQDADSGRVLMLGYMNAEALEKTRQSGRVTFYSRSKQRLWTKGETSGNHLEFVDALVDCDRDTLLVLARPLGPTCHLGSDTCFGNTPVPTAGFLTSLERTIQSRAGSDPEESYTARLLAEGTKRCAQKVGEEGVEVALAAVAGGREELESEAADLLYHLLVCLQSAGSDLDSVVEILIKRHRR
ncbi:MULTISPECIES: bifunctional phosphoribosyl-AMP cyclohydrolase/phosphoribosyl-ATP diphosphatase HisIE [unclassified Wenzhouxiangella]|uniref:bifunctional phosphoribosyl-AMP cyclohydrolase/phosphoribosyl-ATP diphosphatase HisIE n=1 Tax=unclassified Wenzhouxiangella TaxID=2613841 RepID=UPI000E32A891|nr:MULTISPECIES: bifunctional phosphoribosyl-AMP cyclohydrolase/phosphoribosyl-ATP diphosphatase HisIE [unclassified Wenzhouxiangella]RFF27417.1 bifunctional phosphoribosyl-AMP cyclohydrolase/phosphoribosyl-ATP diphosphatase HisIE [Wenzhouxiangella sp. 15181]RFP68845.1 bifunctional phosphoribosyl-AMP cyclohydrolase/phosphoribosyl-ATP diphosphatase HisIE [Wenzhouxiangella sp. 15190]